MEMKTTRGHAAKHTPRAYTWAHELQWYYENFSYFYFFWFFILPIPILVMVWHVPLRLPTLVMSLALAAMGGLGITAGWMIGQKAESWGKVDTSDLEKDPVVIWQHRYYYIISFVTAWVVPTIIAHYSWNDGLGGFVYGGPVRVFVIAHVTFLVNSISHAPWAGSQPYSDTSTATNIPLVAIITLGEANHNYHHAFPSDYRNGVQWHEPDITRWFIWACEKLGLAWDLQMASSFEINEARRRQLQRAQDVDLESEQSKQLPVMTWDNYINAVSSGRRLICINEIIHDITDFIENHPGGVGPVQALIGKDATHAFYHDYPHSPHAETVLAGMRVAITGRYPNSMKDEDLQCI
ncbi:hypothetical protein FQN49_001475 [Arthroderma sp. PD_2]|nr:hypothetical protein FQN49_001475 [Arthroderma sp. PD_2]